MEYGWVAGNTARCDLASLLPPRSEPGPGGCPGVDLRYRGSASSRADVRRRPDGATARRRVHGDHPAGVRDRPAAYRRRKGPEPRPPEGAAVAPRPGRPVGGPVRLRAAHASRYGVGHAVPDARRRRTGRPVSFDPHGSHSGPVRRPGRSGRSGARRPRQGPEQVPDAVFARAAGEPPPSARAERADRDGRRAGRDGFGHRPLRAGRGRRPARPAAPQAARPS